jgi:hypothetical protein
MDRQFKAIVNAQLLEDSMQMILHRLLADEYLLGHFLVLESLCYLHHDGDSDTLASINGAENVLHSIP